MPLIPFSYYYCSCVFIREILTGENFMVIVNLKRKEMFGTKNHSTRFKSWRTILKLMKNSWLKSSKSSSRKLNEAFKKLWNSVVEFQMYNVNYIACIKLLIIEIQEVINFRTKINIPSCVCKLLLKYFFVDKLIKWSNVKYLSLLSRQNMLIALSNLQPTATC